MGAFSSRFLKVIILSLLALYCPRQTFAAANGEEAYRRFGAPQQPVAAPFQEILRSADIGKVTINKTDLRRVVADNNDDFRQIQEAPPLTDAPVSNALLQEILQVTQGAGGIDNAEVIEVDVAKMFNEWHQPQSKASVEKLFDIVGNVMMQENPRTWSSPVDFVSKVVGTQRAIQLMEANMRRQWLPVDPVHITALVHSKEDSTFSALAADEQARVRAELNPTIANKITRQMVGGLGSVSKFYTRNEHVLKMLGLLSFIATAFVGLAKVTGLAEYLKNKVREAFNKPTVYTVRRRKAGMFRKQPNDFVKEGDLVLPPGLRRQIGFIIHSINKRVETAKITKRKRPFQHVLLYGPPGTGKTKLAQMIADQTVGDDGNPMNFIALMASDFMKVKDDGDRMAVLEKMFADAERLGNAIIFLDEIDGMTGQRDKDGNMKNRGFLDKLLEKMGKLSNRFMVIGATNYISRMDEALISRFRIKIHVGLPLPSVRKIIIDKYVKDILTSNGYKAELNTGDLANIMQGEAGRDLEAFVTRLRDYVDYEGKGIVIQKDAEKVLRDMGKLPPLEEETNLDDMSMENEIGFGSKIISDDQQPEEVLVGS